MASLQTRQIVACTGIFMFLVISHGFAAEQEITERDRNAVATASTTNEKKIISARFTWEEERVEAKGAGSQEPPVPAEDLKWLLTKKLTLAGDKMDYYVTIRSRNGKEPGDLQRLNQWSLFDGKKMMEYVPPLDQYPKPHPHGSVHTSANAVVDETTAYPFLWVCRMSKMRDHDLLKSEASYNRGASGDPVIILKRVRGDARLRITDSFWINPAQAYSIEKFQMIQDNKTILDFNVSYQHDGKNDVWIPKTWRYVFLRPDGGLLVSGTGKLMEYVLNPEIDLSEFVRYFPVGTQVVTDDERYIVRENDAKRIIKKEEYVVPYETLLQTEAGMAFKEPRTWRKHATIACILVAMSILVLRIFLRRMRSAKSIPNDRA